MKYVWLYLPLLGFLGLSLLFSLPESAGEKPWLPFWVQVFTTANLVLFGIAGYHLSHPLHRWKRDGYIWGLLMLTAGTNLQLANASFASFSTPITRKLSVAFVMVGILLMTLHVLSVARKRGQYRWLTYMNALGHLILVIPFGWLFIFQFFSIAGNQDQLVMDRFVWLLLGGFFISAIAHYIERSLLIAHPPTGHMASLIEEIGTSAKI